MRKLRTIAVLTGCAVLAGLLGAVITKRMIPQFQASFDVPDHSYGYPLNLKSLLAVCSMVAGGIGLAFSTSLVLSRRFWSRWVLSIALTFVNLGVLLHLLYVLRGNAPGLEVSIHIVVATFFLGLPAVSLLALLHPILVEGKDIKLLVRMSLPLFVLLEGLGGWYFWRDSVSPEKHFLLGWINGALYGLFHGVGILLLAILDRKRPASEVVPEASPAVRPGTVKAALTLGVLLSAVYLGLGIRSYIAIQPKHLRVDLRDREGVLTADDIRMSGWVPDRNAENFSKILKHDGTYELRYEYRDPTGKVAIVSMTDVCLTRGEAQNSYWSIGVGIKAASAGLHPGGELLSQKVSRINWGEERSEFLLADESDAQGLIFGGYKSRTFVLVTVAVDGPLAGDLALHDLLSSVLKRIESYSPEGFSGR